MEGHIAEELVQELIDRITKGEAVQLPVLPKSSLEWVYGYSYACYESGKLEDAVNLFRFLTVFDPGNSRNWLGLGASLQMQKSYEKALEAYTAALALDPENPHICVHAADCCFGLNQIDEGLKALKCAEVLAKGNSQHEALSSQLAFIRKRWSNRTHK